MTNFLYEVIELLRPVIGEELAEETVIIQCQRLGITPEEISLKNINKIAGWVEKVLKIFCGEDIAAEIKEQILKIR